MYIFTNLFSRLKGWLKLIFFFLFFCLFTGELWAQSPPIITIGEATNIQQTSVTVNGRVKANPDYCWFRIYCSRLESCPSSNDYDYSFEAVPSPSQVGYEQEVEFTGNFTRLAPGRKYYWRIVAYEGYFNEWRSSIKSFTTLPLVANNATDITPTSFKANWALVDSADGYYIDVATTPEFNAGTLIVNNQYVSGNSTSYYNVTGLNGSTTYYYRVRPYRDVWFQKTGGNSNVVSVTTLKPTITVTYPNGKEHFTPYNTYEIKWTSQGLTGNVAISYSTDGGTNWIQINSNTNNNGSYNWPVPSNLNSTNCLIRVSSVNDPTIKDESDEPFIISSCGRVWGYVMIHRIPKAYFPVHLTGYVQRTTLTDSTGRYEFNTLPVPGTGPCGVGGGICTVNYRVDIIPYAKTQLEEDVYRDFNFTSENVEINIDLNGDHYNPTDSNYSISGTVTQRGNTPIENVKITLWRREPLTQTWVQYAQTTTDLSGNYSFKYLIGYTSYYVVASKPGSAFTPTDGNHGDDGYIYIPELPEDQTGVNFQIVPFPHKIKGYITKSGGGALPNVVVRANNSNNYTTATDANGYYEITVEEGSYTVIPDSTTAGGIGYNFTPTYRDVTVSGADASNVNFTANLSTGLQIAGKIWNGGVLLNDVTVTLNQYDAGTTNLVNTINHPTPLTNGEYAFTGLTAHYKYEVVVHKDGGFTFIPNEDGDGDGEKTFDDMVSSQVQDFATNVSTGTITGTIETAKPTPVSNITVNITGPFNTSAVTNSSGIYTAIVPISNGYTIEPQLTPDQGYVFRPDNYTGQNIVSGTNTYNFIADTNVYDISGVITGITGSATVYLYDYTGTTPPGVLVDTTTTTSNYTFTGVKGLRDYIIVPVLQNFTFNPNNRVINNLIGNKINQNFTAQTALGPQLEIPNNNAVCVNLSPTFTWSAPQGQSYTGYRIQISSTPDFSNLVGGTYPDGVTTTSTTWQATNNLENGTTYYWRVEGISVLGNNWSEIRSFTTILAAPELDYPENNATVSLSPTLAWKLVNGAQQYEVSVYSDAGCSTVVRGPANVTGTNWTVNQPLLAGQSYWWRVRALGNECSSDYSEIRRFITSSGVPVLKSPMNGAIGVLRRPTFVWYKADGATSYNLQYSTSPTFATDITSFNNITDTTKTLVNQLNILTTYYWRVQANGPGGTTPWSDIWSFRTAAGIISITPNPHVYPTTVVNRVSPQVFTISNDGDAPLRVSSLSLTGPDAANFQIVATLPINIAPHSTQGFIVNYIPKSVGTHNAVLLVDHNDASTAENPLQVNLQGTSIPTAATLNLPNTLNFGNVAYLTAPITRTIQVGNNSTVPGDILILNSYYFENTDGIFEMVTPFPVVLEPGTTYDLVVKFNPTALGTQTNKLHILNTSLNTPDAVVTTVGTVIQGGLIVTPTSIDFGNTSVARPFVLQEVTIQNNSATNITISDKSITGDVSSFTFEKNEKPITLAPNQTDTLVVKFMPPTLGRKNGVINIVSNDPIAPNIFVPMTGIGGEYPVITVIPTEVNFGDIQKNQTKDTAITIRNDGSLDLVITSKTFEGTDKGLFSFILDGSPITLRHGESHLVRIRIKGNLPVGNKAAQLQIMSNDPNNPVVNVNLLASVKTSSLSTVEKVEFDSVGIGYYVDTTILVRNIGNIGASINRLEFDGAFASDFSVIGATLPMEVGGGETVEITIRFKPLDIGLRYARLIIYSTDPVMPELPVVLKGFGKQPKTDIFITDGEGKPLDDGLDFGTVVIFESKTLGLMIKNLSKYAKLRLDSMYLDLLSDQPFSFDKWVMPQIIPPGGSKLLNVTFNPKGLQRSYTGYLNIKFSDSTATPSSGATISTKLKGHVIFPGYKVNLTPVLDFGKVLKDKPSTEPFKIENRGEAYLKIDSIVITGADAEEFKVVSPTFPVTIEPDKDLTVNVSFLAKKVGTKDVKIKVYCNDVFTSGEIKIVAECYVTGDQVTSVTALNEIPTTYALKQNYPNPFNPSTRIEYSIPENSFVSIKVYNSVGQLVATLVNENQSVGTYRVEWSAKNVPSGIYFYRMETSKFTMMKKMLLLK